MFSLARKLQKELLRPVRKRMAAAVEQATARQRAEIETLVARESARQAEIEFLYAQCRDLAVANHRLGEELAELRAHAEGARASVSGLQARVGEIPALHEQIFRLERLVAGTAAAIPPGARGAMKTLEAPAVVAIIPTFNRRKFLPEAIESVQRQTFQNWRLVVVGDGSGPETKAAVAPFLDDPRITFLWQERAGSATARNRAISETGAPLIAYLDDDNLWYPDFLARAVACMATRPDVDVLYGALVTEAHRLDGSCILWTPFNRERLLGGNFIDTSVIVHRRALVHRYGGWDPSVSRLADWDLMLRYTAEKPAFALDVLATVYRVCDGERTSALTPDDAARAEILRRTAARKIS
jgi:Glycosyl transferase family 2